jgi:hypothetical protein
MRRVLGELALFVHFAEARRGMDDNKWREERAKRLAKAVEALSGGRIAGEYAERLAGLIIRYAEWHKKEAEEDIDRLAGELVGALKEDVNRVKGEVWGVVEFVLSDMYCLARDCARDEVVRKFVAPALELIMLDKALRGEFDREEALLNFGEMYATAVAGDGTVGLREVDLAVGGELGGGAVLLRLATLYLLKELLPVELKFDIRAYMYRSVYNIAATGENAAGLRRLLAVSAPSAGGEYLSEKFEDFVEEARVEVRVDNIRRTESGYVAADLTISEAGVAVKYNVYLRDRAIELKFQSTDRSRVELAARLLKRAGVNAEVKKVGNRNVWQIYASTDMLAAGCEELRKALAKVVREAATRGWIDAGKAEHWLKKLEGGLTLIEGWPKYLVRLDHHGSLEVRFASTNPDSIEQEAQRLENMGLKRDVHFSVKMPDERRDGYVYILKEGLAYIAWLSVNGSKTQRELAEKYVALILKRAEEACGGMEPCAVYEKAKEIIEKGRAWSSLELENFEKEFEVNGKKYKVKVRGGEAVEEKQNGKTLLRIKIKVEVSYVEGEHVVRVERDYTITYSRQGERSVAMGYAHASVNAPGGREADAERLAAVIEALTGVKPWIRRKSDGSIEIVCGRKHLDGFMRYKELADTIKKWLEKTSRRRPTH